jgi:low molecular weight protein-tyrosine phosphatase
LILVMDDIQKLHLAMQYPFAFSKLFKLGEASRQDIPDPYRKSPEVFRTAFEMIQNGVRDWVAVINSTADDHD